MKLFWEEILEDRIDSGTRARVHGLNSQMKTFHFYFELKLLHTVLVHADNLSRTFQSTKVSAAEGQHIARLMLTTLSKIRSDSSYSMFWDNAKLDAEKLDSVLPRKRKPPRNHEVGSGESHQASLPVDHYRSIYFETLDTVMASVTDRFDQEGYNMYSKLESILLQKGHLFVLWTKFYPCTKMIFYKIYLYLSCKYFTLTISFHQQMNQFTMLSLWCRVSQLLRRM